MENEYHLLEKASRIEAFQATLCFWLVFLISMSIVSIMNENLLSMGIFFGMIIIVLLILYYHHKVKMDSPYVKLIVVVLLSVSVLWFSVANMNTGSKSLSFLRGWSYASVQIMLVNQFTRIKHKLISVVLSFGLRFGVMGYFDSDIFSVDVIIRHILFDAFVIYIFYTFERKERRIFQSFYSEREELMKFKDLLDNCLPQCITIIDSKNQNRFFSNKAFLNSLGKLPSQPESKSEIINFSQLQISFGNQTITSPLCPLRVEKFSLKSVASVNSCIPSLPDKSVSLEDFIQELVTRNFFNRNALSFEANCLKETENVFFRITVMPVTWDKVSAIAVIFNDVTGERNLDNLKQVDANKDLVLATVAHELRTPLNGIIGMLQATEPKVVEPQASEYISLCKDNAKLLLSLVNSLLDLQQIHHGNLKLNVSSIQIRALLKETVCLFQFTAKEKDLYIDLDVDKNVPEYVNTDGNRLRQILINLIGNALKFTVNGGIIVRAYEDSNEAYHLRISVSDTGIGIKHVDQGRLFKMYSRVDDGEQMNKNGVGLGLAISEKLAKLLGQEKEEKGIEVESQFGAGSKFSFKILKDVEKKPSYSPEKKKSLFCSYEKYEKENEEKDFDSDTMSENVVDCEESTKPFNIGTKLMSSPFRGPSTKLLECSYRTITQQKTFEMRDEDIEKEKEAVSCPMYIGFKDNSALVNADKFDGDVPSEVSKGYILVVDDNPFNLLIVRTLIEGFDYCVQTAITGQEAIDKAKAISKSNTSYVAIFMDCQMPIMDGYETTKILKEMMSKKEIKNMPIVALTANDGDKDIDKCLKVGMVDYLTKPLLAEDFIKIINKLNKQ